MNRYTKYLYELNRNKGYKRVEDLCKYAIRLTSSGSGLSIGKDKGLKYDKLSVEVVRVFSGAFKYDKDLSAYIPVFKNIECTRIMAIIYKSREVARIEKSWTKYKDGLRCHRGEDAILLYNLSKPHLYFMKRLNGDIKIGVSVHPGRRRNEVERKEGCVVQILGIVQSGDYTLESELHERFVDYRVDGEWFNPCTELIEVIKELTNNPVVRSRVVEKPDVDLGGRILNLRKRGKTVLQIRKELGIGSNSTYYKHLRRIRKYGKKSLTI